LSRFRKTARVGADVTMCGRLFQRRLPATGKARSPTVMSRVRQIISYGDYLHKDQAEEPFYVFCVDLVIV